MSAHCGGGSDKDRTHMGRYGGDRVYSLGLLGPGVREGLNGVDRLGVGQDGNVVRE